MFDLQEKRFENASKSALENAASICSSIHSSNNPDIGPGTVFIGTVLLACTHLVVGALNGVTNAIDRNGGSI